MALTKKKTSSFLVSLPLLLLLQLVVLMIMPCSTSAAGGIETTRGSTLLLARKAGGHGTSSSNNLVINVNSYGAKGDGSTDSTQAFAKAWNEACSSTSPPVLLVPAGGSYLLKPITFSGSCKSAVTVRIQGTLVASPQISDYAKDRKHWIVFSGVTNLNVEGGGTIDGNGQVWWKNSCKVDRSKACTDAPTAVTFDSCNKLHVENLIFKNSQQMHLRFEQCTDVVASALTVTAPGTSPNTDGIHVTKTKNILIDNCVIGTGDDCISIVSGSQAVTATNIKCGPGHGISIGSLGKGNSNAYVSDVTIDTATLSGTTNGARIKTWQGGSGYAKNIVFKNIVMKDVKNPIIIDQNYCDSSNPCKQQSSAVAVSDVTYKNIKGTSANDVSITFDCSKSMPCDGIVLDDINLVKSGGGATKSLCNNVKLSKLGTIIPTPCAQSLKENFQNLQLSYY